MPRTKGKYGYYRKDMDHTGKVGQEARPVMSFWTKNKVQDIMLLTPKELDKKINLFLEEWAKNQMKVNKNWWYPSLGNVNDLRHSKEWRARKRKGLTPKKDK